MRRAASCCHAFRLGSDTITVQAEGFYEQNGPDAYPLGGATHLNVQLALAPVETDVQVSADTDDVSGSNGAGTTVLGRKASPATR